MYIPREGEVEKKAHFEPNETGAATLVMYLPSSLALAGGAAISELGNVFLMLVLFFDGMDWVGLYLHLFFL